MRFRRVRFQVERVEMTGAAAEAHENRGPAPRRRDRTRIGQRELFREAEADARERADFEKVAPGDAVAKRLGSHGGSKLRLRPEIKSAFTRGRIRVLT